MEARIFSVVEPTNVETGAIWIKPSPVWAAFIRLGSTWIQMATSDATVIDFDPTTVIINGSKVTVAKESLVIEDILTREADTCTFIIEDSTGANKPLVGQEVQVFFKTDGTTPDLIFAGKITEVPQNWMGIKSGTQVYTYEVTVNDHTQDLIKLNHADTYTDQLAGDIVKDVIAISAKEVGTLFIEDGINVPFKQINYQFPIVAITEIADLIGYDWYVDEFRQLHFFARSTNVAPFQLTDDLSDVDYRDLSIAVNKTQLKNRQIVRGGSELSNLYTQLNVADGQQTSFDLDYAAFAPVSVLVDTGGGFVSKTLGIDNIDSSGFDFVINSSEKVIKNLDLAKLNDGNVTKFTYKYKIPVFAQSQDEDSIEAMKEREGGDGVYEGEIIVDDSILSKSSARQRANAEIESFSNPLVEGTFTTHANGFRSGQLLTVNISSRGENATYLIQNVVRTSIAPGRFQYEITFATRLKSLVDFLIDLYDRGFKSFDISGETTTLSVFRTLKEDITVTDGNLSESRRNTTSDPYKWSNDGGTTPGKGQWNLASWG